MLGHLRHLRHLRRYHSSVFKEGDICLVRQVNRPDRKWLTKPLAANTVHETHKGGIKHDDIIGVAPRSRVVTTSTNLKFSITRPTLEEFVEMADRDAQPIYSQDAAEIVNLADIHIDYPEIVDGAAVDQKHFLEAGTGHGSLALAIARALHPGNCFAKDGDMAMRGAVLHTVDNREQHSKRGQKNVALFNNGMYSNNIDFHVDESPSKWVENSEWKGTEFLSGVFLDMPEPEAEILTIAKHMKTNSPLLVFTPSVTQILKVVKAVNATKSETQLTLVKCVELATGGLKEWDVRSTTVRATGEEADVARPKVGTRIVGGGFACVFRKYGGEAA